MGISFLKKIIIKLYFHLPTNFVYLSTRANSGGIDTFFLTQLEKNDTSGNTHSHKKRKDSLETRAVFS